MRIVWISHVGGDSLGGAGQALVEGAAGLVERGVEVTVVLPSRGRLADSLEAAGASIVVLPNVWWAWPSPRSIPRRIRETARAVVRTPVGVMRLSSFLRRAKPDLVVTNTLMSPLGAFAARTANLAHVWYVHEFGVEDHGLQFVLGERASLGLVTRLSRLVIVNSHAVQGKYEREGRNSETCVIYNAVDVPVEPARPAVRRAELELVLVGMIATYKGQIEAVRATSILAGKGIDVRLRLVGSRAGALNWQRLTALVHELDLEERVEVVGFAQDPAPYVAAADIVLMCSRSEAFGRVTVEAMKRGKPVIGTSSGGTVELVEGGRAGLLYPPGDHEALARQIERLHRDDALRRELGENGRAWAQARFTRDRHAEELLAAFARALSRATDD